MRYSLRWLLAAMAYVALVVAAIGAANGLLFDLVWVATFLACCYALVVAVNPKNRRQAMAIGFLVLAVAHIACIYRYPDRVPTARFASVIGYIVGIDGEVYELDGTTGSMTSQSVPTFVARIANAVVTLVVGLVGCGIGALAYRHSIASRDHETVNE